MSSHMFRQILSWSKKKRVSVAQKHSFISVTFFFPSLLIPPSPHQIFWSIAACAVVFTVVLAIRAVLAQEQTGVDPERLVPITHSLTIMRSGFLTNEGNHCKKYVWNKVTLYLSYELGWKMFLQLSTFSFLYASGFV